MARTKGSRGWGHIRRLPSGRFQASYIGPDRVRHAAPITYSHKQRAEGWLSDERRLMEQDTWTPPAARSAARSAGRVTLAEYAATVIAERTLKPRTRLHYESLLRLHINPTIGKVPIGSLTQPAVRTWHATLSGAPAAHSYGLVSMVCSTAVGDGLLAQSPCTIARATLTPRQREPIILTIAELGTLADKVPERLKAAVLVSAWCGLRWGELTELRRKDIDDDAEVLFVRRAATHRGECRIGTTKSGKGRTIVIPPHVRVDLTAHMETFMHIGPEALVFPPVRDGCHMNDRVFRDALTPALEDIGRDDLRIHDLRHFAGTQIARVGNLVESMQRLGHSTVKASLIYQQVVSGRDAEIAAALSELAEPSE